MRWMPFIIVSKSSGNKRFTRTNKCPFEKKHINVHVLISSGARMLLQSVSTITQNNTKIDKNTNFRIYSITEFPWNNRCIFAVTWEGHKGESHADGESRALFCPSSCTWRHDRTPILSVTLREQKNLKPSIKTFTHDHWQLFVTIWWQVR